MNRLINKEFEEFKMYHKNIFNIKFHILCGLVYMTFLLLLDKSCRYNFFIIYSLMIIMTFKTSYSVFFVLYILMEYFSKKNITFNNLIFIIIIFYMLPEVSHYLTNEKTVLNINNLTPISVIINVLYLLPFSVNCLVST